MGTSNWQNIPFCVEVLMKIAPARVLDVGVGFGRWGMVVREFCDVWYGRVSPDTWSTHVEGIEAYPQNVAPHHQHFYSKIHVMDAAEYFRTLDTPFDVVVFGDVIEHFPKATGRALLQKSLELSTYTLVNVPLGEDWEQDEAYENPYERHLASWSLDDFAALPVVRRALFTDHALRPFASIVLSASDPKDLRSQLFSQTTGAPDDDGTEPIEVELQQILSRATHVRAELDFIKSHSSYRIATRLRRSPAWNAVRWLKTRNGDLITIRALGTKHPQAKGAEVWLLAARQAAGSAPIPPDFIETPDGPWERPFEGGASHSGALKGKAGRLRFPLYAPDPILTFMTHPWGGHAEIRFRGHLHVLDLYSPEGGTLDLRPASAAAPASLPTAAGDASHVTASSSRFSDDERAWLRAVQDRGVSTLALHVPRWLGVTASTRVLFEDVLPFPRSPDVQPDHVTPQEVAHQVRLILESGIRHLVCSGGERLHYDLVRALKHQAPEVRCDLLWHGSYLQWHEDDVWELFQLWTSAAKEGLVHTIGTVKKGMERFIEALGCRSRFVMNYVPEVPTAPSQPAPGGPHLGLWISGHSYRKLPYAMLAATKLVPGAVLHGSNLEPRMRELIDAFGITVGTASPTVVPQAGLLDAIRRTHLSLYVTFSECTPMLPLQSLSVGVPCLTGPNSHLFEDDEFLHRRLVVSYPDRADVIADYIHEGLRARDEIVAAYARYAPGYNARARESVRRFISGED